MAKTETRMMFVALAIVLGSAAVIALCVLLVRGVTHRVIIEVDDSKEEAAAARRRIIVQAQDEDLRLMGEQVATSRLTPEQKRGQESLRPIRDEWQRRQIADEEAAARWFLERVKGKSLADLGR